MASTPHAVIGSSLARQALRIHAPIAQIWTSEKYAAPDAPPSQLAAELGQQLAKRLLQHQGLYVSDHRAGMMVYVSEGVERLLGHSAADFAAGQYALIHPEDRALVTAITVLFNEYISQHVADPLTGILTSTDYRIRHVQGHYVRVLRQNTILSREPNGAMVGSLGILTDISAHKLTTDVRFYMNQPGFRPFVQQQQQLQQLRALPVRLSEREQQVLTLVLEGLTSRQIAQQLSLREATVSTHRRNLQTKVGSHDLFYLLRHLDAEESTLP